MQSSASRNGSQAARRAAVTLLTAGIRKRSKSARAAARISFGANALAAACLAGCTQPLDLDGSLAVVAYDIQPSGRIVVNVEINEQGPYRFAIDTAATGSFLTSGTQADLMLEPVPGIRATVHGAVASGSFPVVEIARLAIGPEVWANARLIALPGDTGATASIDGVLGADFLRRYTIGFSARERRLRLYDPATIGARTYRSWTTIRIAPRFVGDSQEPLHFLDITIAGRSVPALFDLGAGISVLSPAAARTLQLSTVRRGEAGDFSGAVGNEPVVARLRRQDLWTGGVRWRGEVFLIMDLEIFETLDSADSPIAILGSGLFNQRDFIIDFARNRVLVRTDMAELEASVTESGPPG